MPSLPTSVDITEGLSRRTALWLRWIAAALVGVCALASAAVSLDGRWSSTRIARWSGTATAVVACELGILAYGLNRNRRAQSAPLLPTLGVPNAVTLVRGLLAAGVGGFVFVVPDGSLVWLPGVLFLSALSLDAVDGAVARHLDRVTELGAYLDVEFDALALFVGLLVAIAWGQLPVWYLLAGVARYAFVAGTELRRRRGKPVRGLPESRRRQVVGVAQMLVVGVALLPGVAPPATTAAAAAALAALLVSFWIDWRAVCEGVDG